jgi:hypothetical protein
VRVRVRRAGKSCCFDIDRTAQNLRTSSRITLIDPENLS